MAGLIPQSFIDDLLSRADIVDVVDSRVNLKKTGKNYSGLCPFHQEKSPSFSVEPEKQFYYCFGCGAGGNAIGFVMNYENLDFPQAIESLAGSMGIDVPREESAVAHEQREKNQGLYDVLHHAAVYYQAQLRQHTDKKRAIDYLKGRELSGEIVRDFGLGYAPPGWNNLLSNLGSNEKSKSQLLDSGMIVEKPENKNNPLYDRFRDRIMYPIKDRRGRVIAFGGRVLGDDKPKYLNSPETPVFHKGEELYGLYETRKKVRKLERILIVEGYMDVIALAQNDIHYCVATLGTATSSNHLRQLFKIVPEIVFCFDGDNAGKDAAWRALQQAMPLMEDGRSARFLFLPDGEDPDSQVRKIGNQAFVKSILSATQLAEFFFDALGAQVDINSLEGRAKLGTLAIPHINKLPQGIFRELIINRLAQITGVDTAVLGQLEKTNKIENTNEISEPPPIGKKTPSVKASTANIKKDSGMSTCMKIINLIILKPSVIKLLDKPEGLNGINFPDLHGIDFPDIDLLQEIIELAKVKPTSSTHDIMGRIYATRLRSQVPQLLKREQLLSLEKIEKEFIASIKTLTIFAKKKRDSNLRLEAARQKLISNRKSANSNKNTPSSEQPSQKPLKTSKLTPF